MAFLSFLTRKRRIAEVVQVAIHLYHLARRAPGAAARINADPDAAFTMIVEQAVKKSGLKLNAKELSEAIRTTILQSAFEKTLGDEAAKLQAMLERNGI